MRRTSENGQRGSSSKGTLYLLVSLLYLAHSGSPPLLIKRLQNQLKRIGSKNFYEVFRDCGGEEWPVLGANG